MRVKRILEHIQNYKGIDIMIYNDKYGRSFCWGNRCYEHIKDLKREIDRLGRPRP